MFGFLKKEKNIVAPVTGKAIPLSEVPDEAFAQKMVGDGLAIVPSSGSICAPANGTVSLILETNHAFVITTDDGIEIMVHVGVDTVKLKGEGFTRIREIGEAVHIGDEILKVDMASVSAAGYTLVTPVLVLNYQNLKVFKAFDNQPVTQGETTVIQWK